MSRVLDPKALAQILELEEPGEASLLVEMVDIFRAACDKHLTRLRVALEIGDHATVRDAAHALRGAAASLGAERVRSIARVMEMSGRNQALIGAWEQLAALEDECDEALAALSQEVARAA
jgi:two-component system, sensor histidine kinase and response regulator